MKILCCIYINRLNYIFCSFNLLLKNMSPAHAGGALTNLNRTFR